MVGNHIYMYLLYTNNSLYLTFFAFKTATYNYATATRCGGHKVLPMSIYVGPAFDVCSTEVPH